MLGGVAVLGVLTATLSSWIVQRVSTLEEHHEQREEQPEGRDQPE
jgi:voltage-gated potassium channel